MNHPGNTFCPFHEEPWISITLHKLLPKHLFFSVWNKSPFHTFLFQSWIISSLSMQILLYNSALESVQWAIIMVRSFQLDHLFLKVDFSLFRFSWSNFAHLSYSPCILLEYHLHSMPVPFFFLKNRLLNSYNFLGWLNFLKIVE